MNESFDLNYSQDALLNRTYLYDGLNSINLYVEDVDSEYLYETIFKRLLGEAYNVKSIFPCGGKQGVIDAFKERGRFTEGIKNVYVVDGDFDRVLFPDSMIVDSHFVYLDQYNIESCIINEEGLIHYVKSNLKCLDVKAHELLKYNEWRNRIIGEAKDLFFCFCYVQKYNLSYPNVSDNHYNYLDQKTGFLRQDNVIEKYCDKLKLNDPNVMTEIENIKENFKSRFYENYEMLICGKFLLSSLHSYMFTIIKRSLKKEDMLFHFAQTFDLNRLQTVKDVCINDS